MRLLRVIGGIDPAFGGPSGSSTVSCLAVAAAGGDCTVVFPVARSAPSDADEVEQALAGAGACVHTFPLSRAFGVRAPRWALSRQMAVWLLRNAHRYEVVHAHCAWNATTLIALGVARLGGRRAVLTPHESLTSFDVRKSRWPARTIKLVLRALYLRLAHVIVYASELERSDSDARGRARSVVIAHPVAAPRVPAARARGRTGSRVHIRRDSAGEHEQPPLCVGFLGRFDEKKRLDVLLEACAALQHTRLRIAGSGGAATNARLHDRAAALELADRVSWLGFVVGAERESFFASIDVLAMPSAFECFGMAAAEALVREVPVLVSPATGIAELIARHDCGVVVRGGVSAWSGALATLAGDRDALAGLRVRTGRARAELDPASHSERLRAAYRASPVAHAARSPHRSIAGASR